MSMTLFSLCLDQLLRILEQKLPSIRIGKPAQNTAVLAYADNVTIFVTTPTDLPVIREGIQCYKKPTGTCFNTKKLKELAVGRWSTTTDTLDIPYHTEVKILCVTFTSTLEQLSNKSGANVTDKARAHARSTYGRDLWLSYRIRYAQTYLLAVI